LRTLPTPWLRHWQRRAVKMRNGRGRRYRRRGAAKIKHNAGWPQTPQPALAAILTPRNHYGYMDPYTGLEGGSVAEWLVCWTQAQKGLGSDCSRDAVG